MRGEEDDIVAERSLGIDGVHIAICTIIKGLVVIYCGVVLPRIPDGLVVVAEEAAYVPD